MFRTFDSSLGCLAGKLDAAPPFKLRGLLFGQLAHPAFPRLICLVGDPNDIRGDDQLIWPEASVFEVVVLRF
jgi:hypothetical protein